MAPWVGSRLTWYTAAPNKATTKRQMTSVNTASTRVSAPASPTGPGASPPPRSSWWRWRLVLALAVTLALGVGVTRLEIPYLAISPGSAVEVSPLIDVAPEHQVPPRGEFYLMTVRLDPVTVAGALRGWLEPTVEVVARRRFVPRGVTTEELRQVNVAQMDSSKQQALGVAFEELGFDAISGTGAEVVQIVAGSPAAGILTAGDVIVEVAGSPVTTHGEVIEALRRRQPGASIELLVEPEGGDGRRAVTLILAGNPDVRGMAFLGTTLRTRAARFDLPFDVDIASDGIGGPSGGLAFTLEILDVLTQGELTGGTGVAATGTIELDGSVGAVGGMAQKIAVAVEEGIGLFLVPAAEADEARRLAGDRLTVEAVDSLSQALRVLVDHGGDPLSPLA